MRDESTTGGEAAEEHDPDRSWARSHHDRTGEVELIISAALVFGLFQVPGLLDRWFDDVQLRLGGVWFSMIFVLWYYTKLMVYTLIGSFSLHLLTRAYWIGLLGLDSAFPDGVRWDRLRYGPLASAEYRRLTPPLPRLARAADRVGSTIFAAGFWVVLLFALSVMMAGVAGALSLIIVRFGPASLRIGWVWAALMATAALGPGIAIGLDKLLGPRLDPVGPLAGMIRRTVRIGYRILAGPVLLPIQFTLATNFRRGAAPVAMVVVFGVLVGGFIVNEQLRRGEWFVSSSAFFPTRTGPLTSNERYFEDQDPDVVEGVPTLPSEVVRGPYVRLRIPFLARRDEARLRRLCPDLAEASRQGLVSATSRGEAPEEENARLLACVTGLWAVTLDGAPLGAEWSFYATGGNGISGVAAHIPSEPLGPGAHVLEIVEVPVPGDDTPAEDAEPRRHFIRFLTWPEARP